MKRLSNRIGVMGLVALSALYVLVGVAPGTARAAQLAQQPTGSFEASDQPIVDGSVTITRVTVDQDGWIAVFLDSGGRPGRSLGQTAVKRGDSSNIEVKLSEDVPVSGKLWLRLHIDAGTSDTFEFPGPDTAVRDGAGNVAEKQITVSEAPASAQAQPPLPTPSAQAQLPATGSTNAPVGLLVGAVSLLVAGALLTQWRR